MPTPTTNTPTTSVIEPLKVVRDIIKIEMGLKDSQIVLAYQNYRIPADGVFVMLGYLGPSEELANQTYFDSVNNTEVQEVSMRHSIQIEIMSMAPDNSARIRKEEIALALRSFYSQRQQDANLVGIAWLQGDFTDATDQEGTTMLNRYVTTCSVNAIHRKVKASDYFGQFAIQLNTEAPGAPVKTVLINPAAPAIPGE